MYHLDSSATSPPSTLPWSVAAMLSCTAFEFGDPMLTPGPVSGLGSQRGSLHPETASSSPARLHRSLVTATLYPLQGVSSTSHAPRDRTQYGVPFTNATARVTRQSVSIYRNTDRTFFLDISWPEVRELKRHVPPEDPALTEIAVVCLRGVLVLDVSAMHIAAGLWAALQHFQHFSDAGVLSMLQRASTMESGGVVEHATALSPSTWMSPTGPNGTPVVERAQQVLDRFLGPGHNLSVVSSPVAAPVAATRRASLSGLVSPGGSPHHGDVRSAPIPDLHESREPSGSVSIRDRSEQIRREQDEQLSRLRRREEEMRREIHHVSSAKSTPRSLSAASTVHQGGAARGSSPDITALERRRKLAAAGRQATPSVSIPRSEESTRPPLPTATSLSTRHIPVASTARTLPSVHHVTSSSALDPVPLRTSSPSLSSSSVSQPRHISSMDGEANTILEQLAYDTAAYQSTARKIQRDELTSEISGLLDSLGDEERHATAGAAAQQQRIERTLGVKAVSSRNTDGHRRDDIVLDRKGLSSSLNQTEPEVASEVLHPLGTSQPHTDNHKKDQKTTLEPSVSPQPALQPVRGVETASHSQPAAPASATVKDDKKELMASPAAEPLWVRKVTKEGKEYFMNTKTRETSWKNPESESSVGNTPQREATALSPSPSSPAAPAVVKPSVPGEGWKAVQAANGKTYYVQDKTKKTTWNIDDTFVKTDVHQTGAATPPAAASIPSATVDNNSNTTTTAKKHLPDEASKASPVASVAITSGVTVPASSHAEATTTPATTTSADSSHHVLHDTEDTKRENEMRKKAAEEKAVEDKQTIRIGKMTMMEALMREQQSLLSSSKEGSAAAAIEVAKPAPIPQLTAPLKSAVVVASSDEENPSQLPPSNTAAPSGGPTPPASSESSAGGSSSPGGKTAIVAPGGSMYGHWKELYHAESKRYYYRNTETKESSWKMPEEVKQLKEAIAAREAQINTAATASPQQSSSVPRATSATSDASPSTSSSSSGANTKVLREMGGWREMLDIKSNRVYYFNPATKVKQWKAEGTPFV